MTSSNTRREWTVISEIREAGHEPAKPVTWMIGAAVAGAWRVKTGQPEPPKALETKTSGKGSHMIAKYPASWKDGRALVRNLLEQLGAAKRAQPGLF